MRADRDLALLAREELRAVRLQLEYLKPELAFADLGVDHTIVVFGSTRLSDPELARTHLAEAEALSRNGGSGEALERARAALERIPGLGPSRIERFGSDILELVRRHRTDSGS